jgi:hypothetical protein
MLLDRLGGLGVSRARILVTGRATPNGDPPASWSAPPDVRFPFSLVMHWPRPGQAIALDDTFGFPVDAQPHPIDGDDPWIGVLGSDDEDARALVEVLGARGASVVAMRRPPAGWSTDGVDFLGRVALRALVDRSIQVRYALRLMPHELRQGVVLDSLGLLELDRIDLLAGSVHERSLAALGHAHRADAIEEVVRDLARVGLARTTRLSFVLGVAGETAEQVLATVQRAVTLALMGGIPAIRFEWGHDPSRPEQDDAETRSNISSVLDVIRLVHQGLRIDGPEDVSARV